MRALIDSFAASDKTAPRLDNGRLDPFASDSTNGPTSESTVNGSTVRSARRNRPAHPVRCGFRRRFSTERSWALPSPTSSDAVVLHPQPNPVRLFLGQSCFESHIASQTDPQSRTLRSTQSHRSVPMAGDATDERIDASMRPPKRLLGPFESPPSPVAPNDAEVGESGV